MNINTIDYQAILAVAKEAALAAGKYLKDTVEKAPQIEFKGEVDLVTQKDIESQRIIYQIIKKHFPQHSILGEEELNEEKDKKHLWLIDPVDGTINIAHSVPMFCVSIAFLVQEEVQVGVVYIPFLEELYYSVRGNGAYLNGKKLRVSSQTNLGECLVATGFPYDRRTARDNNVANFNRMILKCQDIRRIGSAAIDLCFVASGRFDGFWEPKLKPWDTAAAFLFVLEAGGKVTDFTGGPYNPFLKECLASNGHIHQDIIEVLNPEKP